MSAPSESAASPSPCACTNISLMQLFHELKQKFPGVPDHVVSNTIELYCHDKQSCETHLHREVKASLTHAYHASSSAAARRLNEVKVNPPGKCRNQPIVKHEVAKSTAIKSVTCQGPQTAVLSSPIISINDIDKKVSIDANQNVVEHTEDKKPETNNDSTPVTVINIDNCCVRYNAETLSDIELTNDNVSTTIQKKDLQQPESTNYKILKSNKIKSNLNSLERLESLNSLEKGKEKKTIRKEESKQSSPEKPVHTPQEKPVQTPQEKPIQIPQETHDQIPQKPDQIPQKPEQIPQKPDQIPQDKPDQNSQDTPLQIPQRAKRPDTLNFIKPNPDIAFKQTLKEPEAQQNRTVSPVPPKNEPQNQPRDSNTSSQYRLERGYPYNLSVNVNCHMDLSRYDNPWLEDYNSPRAITSVNLTVCTPTSNMASPVRDMSDEDRGFEGHVTVTVSPSTARAPHRRAPPPPPPQSSQPSQSHSPRPSRAAPEPPGSASDRSLIERQKERRDRLAKALEEEKRRLAQLTRETEILKAPTPAPSVAQSLKEYVERLRSQCDTLSKRLEMHNNEPEEPDSNFYSNIYTGQRPSSYWQCHMCTFRNFPLLNRCEECDMPRIYVGTSLTSTQDSGLGSYRTMNTYDNDEPFVLVENNRALPQLNS